MSERLRILIRYEHGYDATPLGPSSIRLLRPLGHPVNAEAFDVVAGDRPSCAGANVVVVDRYWQPDITPQRAAKLVDDVRRAGACLIYSVDDNLLDAPAATVKKRAAVGLFAREADAMLVSTPALKDRFSELNSRIFVVPNALDERLFRPAVGRRPERRRRQVIGYMGTIAHGDDVRMIAPALRSVLRRRRDDVELQIVGAVDRATVRAVFGDLPVRLLRVGLRNAEYRQFVAWMIANMHFDVGIAPMRVDDFSRCKSDIKYLDYSALGIPGIYSRVPVYEQSVRHLETGYLAENSPEAWREGLNRLLDDHGLRAAMAEAAQGQVFAQRTLERRAVEWRRAIEAIFEEWRDERNSSRAVAPLSQNAADVQLILYAGGRPRSAAVGIESVLRNTNDPRWQLLMIDDHADEATRALLERYASSRANVRLCRNEKRLGPVASFNRGIARASAKYVGLLHGDVVVPPGWLARLAAAAEADPSVALAAPLSNQSEHLSLPMAPGASCFAMDERLADRANAIDAVPSGGFCLLARREALLRHGGFDESFDQFSWAEADLHMRLVGEGWRAVAATDVYVCHLAGGDATSQREEFSPGDEAAFRRRWGEQYDDRLRRFRALGALDDVRRRFWPDGRRRAALAEMASFAWKAATNAARHRDKLRLLALQPRRAIRALREHLDNATPRVVAVQDGFGEVERLRPSRRMLERNVRRNRPTVVFVAEDAASCGAIVKLVNQLLALGAEARVALLRRGGATIRGPGHRDMSGAMFAPMAFDGAEHLLREFPRSQVAVAVSDSATECVRALVQSKRVDAAACFLHEADADAWLRLLAAICPAFAELYVARQASRLAA